MKIYELIKDLNKKVSIKSTNVMNIKKYYLSMYRVNMLYLYDRGYISDPTSFDTKEILGNIVDMGIKGMSTPAGKIELTSEYVGFALAKNKDDEETTEFLTLLYNAVKYREFCINIDKFYDDSSLSTEPKKKLSFGYYQSASKVLNKGCYDIDNAILECVDSSCEYEFVSLNEYVYNTALSELEIEYSGDESIFVKGLTKDEEIEYANLILNGLVRLDGIYSDKLIDWLKNNKWSSHKFSSKQEGFYNWVLYIKSIDTIEEQARLLNTLLDEGYTIVSMKSNGFYVKVAKEFINVPVGVFAVVSEEDSEVLPDNNKLEGYTGEVYSLEYLINNELNYVGCPIELYVDNKTKGIFVDKEQTELSDYVSWFKYYKVNIDFPGSLYEYGVFPVGSPEDDLYKILGDSEAGNLVGKLNLKGKDFETVKKAVNKKL